MTPRQRGPRRGQNGFVLIGVVIFVLALTIIGISLFSLSTYEAQFLQRSLDGEQAFQSALGGIERAKFALARENLLSSVKDFLPLENVTSVTAIQVQGGLPDTVGPVQWQGEDVTLRVSARVNEEQRTIEGRFRLLPAVYSQVIATNGGIYVEGMNPPGTLRQGTVQLSGPVWQGTMPPDTNSWKVVLRPDVPAGITTDPVALPRVAEYMAAHLGSSSESNEPTDLFLPPDHWRLYGLFAGVGNVRFFTTPGSMTGGHEFSLYDNQTTHDVLLGVSGCAVWLMPQGVRFDKKVKVIGYSAAPPGTSPDCLIIVAGRSGSPTYDPDAGIWFADGLQSTIPVILVSDGTVRIQHLTEPAGDDSWVPELTVYARDVVLTGPETSSGKAMWLAHQPGDYLDTYWVPHLADGGYLPNISSTRGHELCLRPGTWLVAGR